MKTSQWPTADGQYYIESYGNGWAYSITKQSTGENVWVQDSDADMVREDTKNFEYTDCLDNYFGLN